MATRRQIREWALQMLFQRDFNRLPPETAWHYFWKDDAEDADDKARKETEALVAGIEMQRKRLDTTITTYAQNWSMERMGVIDRNVLRLALYEMMFREDIPPVVSINEAVDLAKFYSNEESGRFVNGILDRACRDLTRPSRTAISPGGHYAG